jgi:hypothetical protein
LEAHRAFLPPAEEPDAQQEAAAAVAEPGAQREAAVAAAEPGAQREAVVAAAEPDAQREAAVAAAEPDAQREAVVAAAEPGAQQQAVVAGAQWQAVAMAAGPGARQQVALAAEEPVAQRQVVAAAAEPDAQRQVVAAAEEPGAQRLAAVPLVQPLELSVEFAEAMVGPQWAVSCSLMATTARQILAVAVRLWIRAALLSADVPESPVASAAKGKAAVDPRPVAYRLLAAAVVRPLPAAADRLWFQEVWFSAAGLREPPVSAKQQATADRRRAACRSRAAAVVRLLPAAADRPWFPEAWFSAPVLQEPQVSAKQQAMVDRRRAACRSPVAYRRAAAVVRPLPAAADRLWFREESFSAPALEASAKQRAMADRRRAACRSPVAYRRAASGREECLAESYFGLGSPWERPMAAARAQARQPRRLQQRRHLQWRRWKATISFRREAMSELQEPEVAERKSGSVHSDW